MSPTEQRLHDLARQLGRELKARNLKLVLAESCTGGMVSTALVDVPGISDVFCGSAVAYRDETKANWLGISHDLLQNSRIGAVSPHVAEAMCLGVLERTPESDLAAAVTGHLGPNAPPQHDGMVSIGVAQRNGGPPVVQRRTLSDSQADAETMRHDRQREAACLVLEAVVQALARLAKSPSPAALS
jgi:PncC family amidohydrolase